MAEGASEYSSGLSCHSRVDTDHDMLETAHEAHST
eukprot:CAMPEP_0175492936 /NCGR_PEP_ID=MMETSP0096-20121207/2517_1 /TAXON_ID=311494 /ORGANISM="Alexandrium monilatum, Strain CCMP3105" /LENGTH=34 /DNA_ID= /DNA_START= /DNA_END= /DNA_ORIENTATION=